jgi:hypothetical protein
MTTTRANRHKSKAKPRGKAKAGNGLSRGVSGQSAHLEALEKRSELLISNNAGLFARMRSLELQIDVMREHVLKLTAHTERLMREKETLLTWIHSQYHVSEEAVSNDSEPRHDVPHTPLRPFD